MTAHADPIAALRGANRSTKSSGLWTQKILVILQAAISLGLLCTAGLLIRSLTNLQHQHFGFDTHNRYILHVDPQMAGYKADQAEVFYRQLHDTLAALPGVRFVTYGLYSPMEGNNWGNTAYIEGQAPPAPGSNSNDASWDRVSPGYFENIGTRLVAGRTFTDQDNAGSRNVAVVNQAFAKRFFKDSAIGHHFGDLDQKYSGNFEIVGVVEDAQYWDPDSKIRAMFFLPANQWSKYDDSSATMFENVSHLAMDTVVIQTAGHLPGLESQVRNAINQINPNLTVNDFETFETQVRDQFIGQEILVRLTSIFGFVALALAAIGLYGVTSYSVAQRTSEIGIRMALGADRIGILQMVLRSAFLQAGIGLVIGLPAAIVAGHLMASHLYGVQPWDPPVLLGTTVVLALAALLAAVIPAQRAAGVDPMVALRVQ
jgi:predicted permease